MSATNTEISVQTLLPGQPRPRVEFRQAFHLFNLNKRNFSGRSSRSEFWWVWLGFLIVGAVFGTIGSAFVGLAVMLETCDQQSRRCSPAQGSMATAAFFFLILLVICLHSLIAWIALSIRRMHDINRSGWMLAIGAVPIVGLVIVLVLLAQPSDPAGARFDDPYRPVLAG
jgi:uncharacterized membrane protein YhaH (DUF805 family)